MLRYVPCRVLVLFMTNGCEQEGLGLVCPYLNPTVTQCGPTAAYTQLVLSVSGPSLSKILYCCCCSCCSNANMIIMETYRLPQQHVVGLRIRPAMPYLNGTAAEAAMHVRVL